MAVGSAGSEQETFLVQLKQQRLPGWQLTPKPQLLALFYVCMSLAFLGLGGIFLNNSWSVLDTVTEYTSAPADEATKTSTFTIEIEQDVLPPIQVYYQLDGFHQNHRNYVKSLSRHQLALKDERKMPYHKGDHDLESCSPWIAHEETGDERVYYPCGLIARSVFTDTFVLAIKDDTEGAPEGQLRRLKMNTEADQVAWQSERSNFKNLDPEAKSPDGTKTNQEALDMWILKQFPPQVCEQQTFKAGEPFAPATVSVDENGLPKCKGYMSGKATCEFTRSGKPFKCDGEFKERQVKDWGIESGHFNSWMHIAGLPNFRKKYGVIEEPLKAGSSVTVFATNDFDVSTFGGKKLLVLATSTSLGGRNDFIGYAYLVVGVFFLVFAANTLRARAASPS